MHKMMSHGAGRVFEIKVTLRVLTELAENKQEEVKSEQIIYRL